MSPVMRSTVATPSSSMRSIIASGSAKASESSRRTFTWTPVVAIAPSQVSRRSGVNAFERQSTIPPSGRRRSLASGPSALIAEPLQLGRHVDFGPVVELPGAHDLGLDPHAETFLEPLLGRRRDRGELAGLALTHDRHDQLVAGALAP